LVKDAHVALKREKAEPEVFLFFLVTALNLQEMIFKSEKKIKAKVRSHFETGFLIAAAS